MQKADTFTVIWRQGGNMRCRWNKILTTFRTAAEAQAKADEVERMGYKTLIHSTAMLDIIGMPIGFDATCADWVHAGNGWYVSPKLTRAEIW